MLSKTFRSMQKFHDGFCPVGGGHCESVTLTPHSPKPSLSNNHRLRLIFLSDVVARKPHPRKIPPPLSVPSNFRNRLKTRDLIFVAPQLEYGQSVDDQKKCAVSLPPSPHLHASRPFMFRHMYLAEKQTGRTPLTPCSSFTFCHLRSNSITFLAPPKSAPCSTSTTSPGSVTIAPRR